MALPPDTPSAPPSGGEGSPARAASRGENQFVYVKIPVGKGASDPFHRREDHLDQHLRAQGIGWVVGWGDSLGEMLPSGSRVPAFVRVDISVVDLAAARMLLRTLLSELGDASGVEIHYTVDAKRLQDVCVADNWLLERPVTVSRLRVPGAWR